MKNSLDLQHVTHTHRVRGYRGFYMVDWFMNDDSEWEFDHEDGPGPAPNFFSPWNLQNSWNSFFSNLVNIHNMESPKGM
jgi:hypothetical protein